MIEPPVRTEVAPPKLSKLAATLAAAALGAATGTGAATGARSSGVALASAGSDGATIRLRFGAESASGTEASNGWGGA